MFDQPGAVRGEAAEHEALVGVHPRNPSQIQVQLALAVALEERESDKLTVVAVCPAVIRTAKSRRIAFGVIADLIAAVGATVEQQMQFPVTVAGDDHVLQPEALAHIVVWLRHFAFVADENPSPIPDPAQFFGEDSRVGIQRPMHLVSFDQWVIATAGGGGRLDE